MRQYFPSFLPYLYTAFVHVGSWRKQPDAHKRGGLGKKIVGNESLCRELAYTGRNFGAAEAARMGLVSRILGSGSGQQDVVQACIQTAVAIAKQSPVAVFGTKRNLIYGRDHSIEDGLEYAATWNGAALQTEDLSRAIKANLSRRKNHKAPPHPSFSKL